jgi:hypothetical protein
MYNAVESDTPAEQEPDADAPHEADVPATEETTESPSQPVVDSAYDEDTTRNVEAAVANHVGDKKLTIYETINQNTAAAAAGVLHSFEHRNWLLHLHFIREEFDMCRSLITVGMHIAYLYYLPSYTGDAKGVRRQLRIRTVHRCVDETPRRQDRRVTDHIERVHANVADKQ